MGATGRSSCIIVKFRPVTCCILIGAVAECCRHVLGRTDNLIGIAEKFNWETTLRSPGRNRETDVRSTWDARRQLEGLEERTASAVAYLHRQLLDLQAAQSPKTSSDVAVRLDALEQKQQQTAHRLDAVADVASSCSKEQDVRRTVWHFRLVGFECACSCRQVIDQSRFRTVCNIPGTRATPSSFAGQAASHHMLHQRGSACFV